MSVSLTCSVWTTGLSWSLSVHSCLFSSSWRCFTCTHKQLTCRAQLIQDHMLLPRLHRPNLTQQISIFSFGVNHHEFTSHGICRELELISYCMNGWVLIMWLQRQGTTKRQSIVPQGWLQKESQKESKSLNFLLHVMSLFCMLYSS